MSSLIQIRNVPEDVHRKLTERATASGKSLNSLMLEIVEREVERPTMAEVVERILARSPLGTGVGPGGSAEIIRDAREERDGELLSRTGRAR
jgi:plasmid stability protein